MTIIASSPVHVRFHGVCVRDSSPVNWAADPFGGLAELPLPDIRGS